MELAKGTVGKAKPKIDTVDLSEFFDEPEGMTAYIRLVGADVLLEASDGEDNERNERELLIHWCAKGLCDKDGEPLYADESEANELQSRDFPFAAISKIATAIIRFNGLEEGDAEKNLQDRDGD